MKELYYVIFKVLKSDSAYEEIRFGNFSSVEQCKNFLKCFYVNKGESTTILIYKKDLKSVEGTLVEEVTL